MNGDNKIAAFWKWFSDHSLELESRNIHQNLVAQLENRLFSIKRVDWEIGPGVETPHRFTLSLRGDADALEVAREIINRAPVVPDWEFSAGKSPKKWNLVFNLMIDGASYKFDGKLWEFVAYKFKDGTYDLVFKPDSTKGLIDKYLYWAGSIIVDGELGEEKGMAKIGKIEIVSTWDEKSLGSARQLEVGLLDKIIK